VSGLALEAIAKRFGASQALAGLTLDVAPGEVLALTGPSGAGKTTLCRIVAGLEHPDAGECCIDGRDVLGDAPGRRRIAYMFESYALYPHLTVAANVASPLRAPNGAIGDTRRSAGEIDAAVAGLLDMVGIGELHARLPAALSGGQKQRVALARTLVQDAAVTLLDEPISHLDAKLRHRLRGEIRRRLSQRRAPTIWSTPDGLEALAVGDRVAVIDAGRIEQVATPEIIWQRPATVRVARLLGDPPMNLIPGRLATQGHGLAIRCADGATVTLPAALAAAARGMGGDGSCVLGVRPETMGLAAPGEAHGLPVDIYSHEAFGKHAVVTTRLGDLLVKVKTRTPVPGSIGDRAVLLLPATGMTLFDGASGRAIAWTTAPSELFRSNADA